MATDRWDNSWAVWAFSPSVSAILVTLLVIFLSPVLLHFYWIRKAAPKQLPTILLLGPSGGGKTSLLTSVSHYHSTPINFTTTTTNNTLQFSNGTPSTTHTSQAPQTALCQLPSNHTSFEDRFRSENDNAPRVRPKFLLLDTPGHGKLRHHALSALKTSQTLKGLIFMLDSAAVSSAAGLTEAAEYLHDVLLALQKRHTQGKTSRTETTPVLVAANKQDVFTSLPAGIVRARLEEEIAKVRVTRSRGLMESGVGMENDVGGGVDEEQNWLGEFGSKQFRFAQMEEHGVEVGVVGGNVKGEEGKAGSVGEWWAWVGNNL